MALEGDRVVDLPINKSLESQNTVSQCNPEAQPEKKKKKKSRKSNSSTLKDSSIGADSCHGSLTTINAETDSKIAALPVLTSNNNSLESHHTDSQCNLEAQPEKIKKKRRKKNDSSTLKDASIGTDSCHGSLITINAETDLKIAVLPVLSSNNNSSESHDADSQCNPEAEPEKKKKKSRRKNKDTTIDIHVDSTTLKDASIRTDSNRDTLSEFHGQADINTTFAPILSGNHNISESHDIDSHCNPEAGCPQPKKKKRKRKLKERDASDDIDGGTSMVKVDSSGNNACHDSLAEIHAQGFGTPALPVSTRNNYSLESHDIDSHCNPEAECPQPKKKKKKKRKLKDKDASNDINGDTSVLKDDAAGPNACHNSLAGITAQEFVATALPVSSRNNYSSESHDLDSQCNPEAECAQPKKKKKKKKKRKLADKDGSTETSMGHDSLADINAAPEFQAAAFPVLGRNNNNSESYEGNSQINPESECSQAIKKKKKRKPKDKDVSIGSHADASKLKGDSPVTDSCHMHRDKNSLESHNIDSQSNSEALCSQPIKKKRKPKDKDASIDSHENASKLKLQDDPIATNSCHDSLVRINTQTDTETSALPVLSRKEKKRMRKKQKLDAFITIDTGMDAVGTENGLQSEKQNYLRSKSVNKVENYDNNDEGAFSSNGNENAKKKTGQNKPKLGTSVKIVKPEVPPAKLDGSDEKNALKYVNETDCQSNPISSQRVVHIFGGNESSKTNHIEENSRLHSRKRRKSAETKENMQPITVAAQVSSDSDQLHLTKISNNEVEGVHAGKVAASIKGEVNVLAEKTSDCSSDDFPCSGSQNILEINKSSSLNTCIENPNERQLGHPLVGAHVGYSGKKLLILDVNGLLVDVVPKPDHQRKHDIVVSKKYVYKRPFCDDFLQFCFEKFSVGIWTSRLKENLDKILNFLMADSRHKLLFCWDQSHCTDTGFTTTKNTTKPLFLKELKKVWDKLEPGLPWNKGEYNEINTLLLDDSPYKALTNPANTAIFPTSYNHKKADDSSLGPGGDLRVYLEKLAEAPNVQEYVACNPFGQKAITKPSAYHRKVLSSLSRRRNTSSSTHTYIGNS